MPSRRFKVWLLLSAMIVLVGVFSGILLAGSIKKNAIYTGSEVLSPANEPAALVRVHAASSVDDIQDPEESASSFGSSTTNGTDTTSVSNNSEPVFANGLAGHHTVAKEYSRAKTVRMMKDASDQVCDVYQPDVPYDCGNLAGTGVNHTYRLAAQAVGHLEIDDDGISCSGVLLDGDSKTVAYFLTAAKCLPNEKNFVRARIRFTGICAGANSYAKNTVYAISRRLGYVILRVEANVKAMRERYSFLRLRAATRVEGEEVFIVHNPTKRGLQRITTQVHGLAIKIREQVSVQGCAVESPRSRVSYVAPRMDRAAVGAPVVSTADGAIVALHLCGDCSVSSQNSALKSNAILVDLANKAQSINGFAQKPHTKK